MKPLDSLIDLLPHTTPYYFVNWAYYSPKFYGEYHIKTHWYIDHVDVIGWIEAYATLQNFSSNNFISIRYNVSTDLDTIKLPQPSPILTASKEIKFSLFDNNENEWRSIVLTPINNSALHYLKKDDAINYNRLLSVIENRAEKSIEEITDYTFAYLEL